MRQQFRSDRGASIFMLAISLFLLIGASALAVDIGAIWLDRSTDQKVTDAAAAAGILEAHETGGEAACETALTYVAVNTPDLNSVDSTGCVDFDKICEEPEDVTEKMFPAGRYEITVVYPVDEGHDLMTSRIISRTEQPPTGDGKPCERLGVKMTSTRDSLFASVLGFDSGTTTVHTVAKRIDGDLRPPFNLLVLDRTGCPAIDVGGGGGIIADAVIAVDKDGDPTGLVPGIIAADSDGSDCSPSKGVINVSGGGSLIRSDGPECPNPPWTSGTYMIGSYTAYEGCGQISVYAPGTPGCNWPACTVSSADNEPVPPPTPLGDRYTRKVADYTYNCYADYTNPPDTDPPGDVLWASPALTEANQQYIDPCEEADGTNDYIYKLIQEVDDSGLPDGSFELWSDLPHGCDNIDFPVEYSGNVVVDCDLKTTEGGSVTINGNAVFNGKVSVSGSLTVNPPDGDDAWIFFRDGLLSKTGSGEITFNNAMVYMSKTSDVKLTGGSGALIWTAPEDGQFKSLALWSDSPSKHAWSGQATLTMRGIFFMPWAEASYSGNGDMQQTEAQWIAWRVSASGNGALRIAPPLGGGLTFPDHATNLIR